MTRTRSYLFVPGNRPERFAKAAAAGADVVILDLEDAVAPAGKAAARDAVHRWFTEGGRGWLRLNGSDTDWHADDLALLGLPGVQGAMLPKAEDPTVLAAVADLLGGRPLVPLVETALGLWRAHELARTAGVWQLAFGSVDYQLDLGITGDGDELLQARSQLVLASRVAGVLPPIDGVTVDLDDPQVLHADVARARRLGFGGKLAIHPRQIEAIHAGFGPTADELAWAQRVVDAAQGSAGDAVRLDGKLIDKPIIDRARALLQEVPTP